MKNMPEVIKYKPKKESLKKHEVPSWFHDAKLGIFIHWGLYSVPAYATNLGNSVREVVRKEGIEGQFKNSPYAEWYCNTIRIDGSSARQYHADTYGENSTYDDLIPIFNEEIKKWNPDEMAKIIKKSGAKYVVLVTKHHDGFLLWHSDHPNPIKEGYMANRDIVKELTGAVKKQGLKMGYYYSGSLDWSFNPDPITDAVSYINNGVMTPEYTEYANNHWYELIEKYNPMILWGDIGYPPNTNIFEIWAYFYNKNPDGVINDRWAQMSKRLRKFLSFKPIAKIVNWAAQRVITKKGAGHDPLNKFSDFANPEYAVYKKTIKKKWEQTRGIGQSFGYNQFEREEHHLSKKELIHEFIDLVSKNGNLLLNVGPKADGSIPEIQEQRLVQLGNWLKINGEGIYGTRPWTRAEAMTTDGINVRFTQKGELLFAFLLGKPDKPSITIKKLIIHDQAKIMLLGTEGTLNWKQEGKNLTIKLPEKVPDEPASCFSIYPKPKN